MFAKFLSLTLLFAFGAAPVWALPVISNVRVTENQYGRATLAWTTSEPATTRMDWGATAEYGQASALTGLRTDHSLTVTNFPAATMVNYRIVAVNGAGQVGMTPNRFLPTAADPARCWPNVPPLATGVKAPPVPAWCVDVMPAMDSTAVVGPNAWVDTFDNGNHMPTQPGPDYVNFERIGLAGPIYASQMFIHHDHYMRDVAPMNRNGDGVSGGGMMRPNKAFRFENGKFVVEADVAVGLSDYIVNGNAHVWPEMIITNAPAPTNREQGLYGKDSFNGYWTLGCEMSAVRFVSCILISDRPDGGERNYAWDNGVPPGRVHYLADSDHVEGFRNCTGIPPASCYDRIRIEFTRNSLKIFANNVLWQEESDFFPGREFPDVFLNNNLYVYFADWVGRPPAQTARFHWDRIAVNPPALETAPPAISNVGVTNLQATAATIVWNTNEPADSQVRYDVINNPAQMRTETPVSAALVTSHAVPLTNLTPNTRYYYRALSLDAARNMNHTVQELSFVTPAPSTDATAPTVTLTAPANGATVSGASVNVTANAADNVGVAGVQFVVDGMLLGAEDAAAPYAAAWNTGMLGNGSHTLLAIARDAAGNTTASAPVNVTVSNSGQISIIQNITVSNVTNTSALLTWTTTEPADAQVEYGPTAAYGALTPGMGHLMTSHSQTLTGLSAGTIYHFRVRATNGVGGLSLSQDQMFMTTGAMPAGMPGDMNNDGLVNITDLSLFLNRWNSNDAVADFNDDGNVGIADLSLLLSHWSQALISTQAFGSPAPGNRLAASLKLISRARRSQAEPMTLDLFLDSPQAVNAVQVSLVYPADKITLLGVDDSASAFGIAARAETGAPGALLLARGNVKPLSGRMKIATLSFRSDAPADMPQDNTGHGHAPAHAGVYPVMFTRGSLALTAGGAVNVLAKADGLDLSGRLTSQVVLTPVPADGINDQMIFDPDVAAVVVFDVNGRKVYAAESLAGASLSWNGRDERGAVVSSGLYIMKTRKADGAIEYRNVLVAK